MPYTPDPTNTLEPTDDRPAGSAAEEFRRIKDKIAGDADGFGFKSLRHNTYTGESTVLAADNGKAHRKLDATAVAVPNTLPLEFLCTILNVSSTSLSVNFTGGVAYMQGSEDAEALTALELLPYNSLNITKVAVAEDTTGIWFVSGKAIPA